jgi:hypothetical protein
MWQWGHVYGRDVRVRTHHGGSSSSTVVARAGAGNGGKDAAPQRAAHALLEPLLQDERLSNVEPRMVEMILNEILTSNAPVDWR